MDQAVSQPAAGTGGSNGGQFGAYLATKENSEAQSDPTPQAVPESPSPIAEAGAAYQELAPVAGQTAGLGFGTQMNAGLQTLAGAFDQVLNGQNNFGDSSKDDANVLSRTLDAISNMPKNYSQAKKGIKDQIAQTRINRPVESALSEIAAGLAPLGLGGVGLKGVGLANKIAQAGTLGGTMGYGLSNNEGLDRVIDAAKSAALAAGTAGLFEVPGLIKGALKAAPIEDYIASEYANYGQPIISIAKAKIKETPYGLNFKPSLGETYQISEDMAANLRDENVRGAITHEFNEQPQIIDSIIGKTKEKLGLLKAPILEQHGDAQLGQEATDSFLTKMMNKAQDIKTAYNPVAEGYKKDLMEQIQEFAANTKGNATLKQTTDFLQGFGKTVFEDKAYSDNLAVHGTAKKIWGMAQDAANKIDESEAGSGGQISTINKVFKAMYGMDDANFKGTTVRQLVNPESAAADSKYMAFVKPFEDLPPNVRQTLAPEMHDYLANQFPKIFAKAKAMVAVNAGDNPNLAKSILSLSALQNLKPQALASRLGSVNASVDPSIAAHGSSLMDKASSLLNTAAPIVGGRSVSGQ